MPNFEVYQRSNSNRHYREPMVTVERRAQIALNPAALHALGYPDAITFLVDKDERLLGFRPAGIVENSGRKKAVGDGAIVRPQGIVAAVRVLRYMEADLSASRRYPLIVLDGVHCIDLKEPGKVVTSNRAIAAQPEPPGSR